MICVGGVMLLARHRLLVAPQHHHLHLQPSVTVIVMDTAGEGRSQPADSNMRMVDAKTKKKAKVRAERRSSKRSTSSSTTIARSTTTTILYSSRCQWCISYPTIVTLLSVPETQTPPISALVGQE